MAEARLLGIYLEEWEKSINNLDEPSIKKKMKLLPNETILGLIRITGKLYS